MRHVWLIAGFVLLMALAWQQGLLPGLHGGFQQDSSTHLRLSASLGQRRHSGGACSTYNLRPCLRRFVTNAGQQPHSGSSSDDVSGRGPAGKQPHAQQQRPGLLRQLFAQFVALVRLAAALVLLIVAAPYLLSSRLGTTVAAAAASRMLPGDVRIQSISLGWTQPLSVHGLTIYEGAAGRSRQLISLQRFASAEPLHDVVTGKGHLTLTLNNPSIDCSLADSGDNFRLVQYLQDSHLLDIIRGRSRRPSPAQEAAAAAAALEAAAREAEEAAAAAAAKLQSHPIDVSDAASAADESGAPAALDTAGAPAAAPRGAQAAPAVLPAAMQGMADSSSSSRSATTTAAAPGQPAETSATAAPANFIQRLTQADASSHVSVELRLPMLSVYIPDGKLLLPRELGAAMGSHIHAVAAAGRSAVGDLAEELEEDCSWLRAQGQQQQQQAQVLQQQEHQEQQQQQMQQGEGKLQLQQQQGQQQQEPSRLRPGEQHQEQRQDGSGKAAAAAAIDQHEPWPLPPPSISKKAWAHATPLMLQLSGERVSALVRGWHLGSVWRISRSILVLEQPATATWEFTPELAALTLSQFNPLLQEVALIREGGQLMTSMSPAEGTIPAHSGQLWVSPVKLVVGRGNLLSQIYRLLGLHGRFGSSGSSSSSRKPWMRPKGGSSGSAEASAAAAAREQAAASAADDGSAVRGIDVWSGPLRVSLEGPGRFRTDRVDMILGSGRNSLHLALWGTVDTNSNTLTMTVGLPASTLSKAGLRGLPPDYMLPVAVSGPLHRPQVEWNAAVRQLAVLSAMQLGREAWEVEGEKVAGALWGAVTHQEGVPAGLTALFGAANRALMKATSSFIGQVDERLQSELCGVPPPADLPWEHAAVGHKHGQTHNQHAHHSHHTPTTK